MKRVARALTEAGIETEIQELGAARTAQEAADGVGCHIDQIAKSIIFAGVTSGEALLFLTAGGNLVDADKASAVAGEPLTKADAALIRAQTGFAIGGVAPVDTSIRSAPGSIPACWNSTGSGPQRARRTMFSVWIPPIFRKFPARKLLILHSKYD